MKKMRPLEMVLLIVAIIVLVVSMYAVGMYGPELVKFIQHGGVIGADNSSPLKIIISRIADVVIKNFTSRVNACEMNAAYGSTRAIAIDSITGQVIEPDYIRYSIQ
jgi:hypothetical protein